MPICTSVSIWGHKPVVCLDCLALIPAYNPCYTHVTLCNFVAYLGHVKAAEVHKASFSEVRVSAIQNLNLYIFVNLPIREQK